MAIQKIEIGDCREVIKKYSDNFFDCLVTSPPYYCYDSETEILTFDGWKYIKDVIMDEKVMTLNPITKEIEWGNIISTNKQVYNGKMIQFKNNSIDLLVTPNHRMYVFDDKSYPIRKKIKDHNNQYFISNRNQTGTYFIEAKDIKKGHLTAKTGFLWKGNNIKYFTIPKIEVKYNKQNKVYEEIRIKIEDWLAFFGLWIAEGSVRGSNGGKKKVYEILIKQKYPKSIQVEDILNKLPFLYHKYHGKNNIISYSIVDCQLWYYLKQFGNSHTKYIPSEIKELNTNLLNIFLKWYLFGDGCINKTTTPKGKKHEYMTCYSVSKKLLDDLCEIAIKIGSNTLIRKDGKTLFFLNRKTIKLSDCKSEINYNGNVYCVEVNKNNIICVRRNGKIAFSGNSMRNYNTPPLIYGGKSDCNHQWIEKIHKSEGGTAVESTTVGANKENEANNRGGEGIKYWLCPCGAFKGELGWEPTPELFIRDLIEVFEVIRPKIKETGSIWVNLGDKWIDLDQQLIPEQFALGMKKNGWILINKITWVKSNSMPESVKRRLSKTSELIFHFVKNRNYWYDLDAIREPHKTQSLERYQRAINLGSFAIDTKYGDRHLMGMPTQPPKWFTEGANTGVNNKEPYKSNNPHRTRLYEGKFTGMGEGYEQFGSPRARNERQSDSKFLKSNQKTASPGARAILSERDGKLTTFVRTKLQECGQHLKYKLKQSNYTIEQLSDIIGIKETTLSHYFRTDLSGQAIPDRDTWEALQELIGIGEYEDYISEEIKDALPNPHPFGKNPGDTWEISTQSYSGAHFAVFPLSLVRIPILATCPTYICKKCGKPRERIMETITINRTASDGKGNGELADGSFGSSIQRQSGWSDCQCRVGYDVGWVLDPFAGSGTTLEFCRKENRNAVGIELNPNYVPLIVKRAKLNESQVKPIRRIQIL